MAERDYRIGDLLNDKNAIMNYIYDKKNMRIGIVVGMKGKDRDNPLVGWCLFREFVDYEDSLAILPIEKVDYLRDTLRVIDAAIDSAMALSEDARKKFDMIKKLEIITPITGYYSDDIVYKVTEKALLRANSNRDNFFVCKNPVYGQYRTILKPSNSEKRNPYITWDGEAPIITDSDTLTSVRRAVRAMEFRCWKYFKDGNSVDTSYLNNNN